MYYEGKEHKLLVDFDEQIDIPTADNQKIKIPVMNNPYNLLVYHTGKAELWAVDYNEERVYLSTPCTLSPMERENIMRLYYPLP